MLPEALGVDENEKLPNAPCEEGQDKEGCGVKSADKSERGEHHEMVPVENAAGGAAAGLHQKPERAPDEHADEVADVEGHGAEEERDFTDAAGEVQSSEHTDERTPQQHDLVRALSGLHGVAAERFVVDLLADGLKAVLEQLLRAERHLVFDGDDLQEHIDGPKAPKQMERGEAGEKVHAVQYIEFLRCERTAQTAENKHDTAPDKA